MEKPQEITIDTEKETRKANLQDILVMETSAVKNPASKDVRDHMLRMFYSVRPGNFEHAVEDVKRYLDSSVDGNFVSAWLLAEIDHWDHEKERLCIITEKQLLVIKYSFVALRIEECKRVHWNQVEKIQGGKFIYPKHNMILNRTFQTGIRIQMKKDPQLTLWQKWNPLFNDLPFFTFTQHKAVPLLDEIPPHMDYCGFKQGLISTMEGTGHTFEASSEEIPLEIYIGLMSMVHNSNDFGYSKDRGPVSF